MELSLKGQGRKRKEGEEEKEERKKEGGGGKVGRQTGKQVDKEKNKVSMGQKL